jgi:alkanesulfonate monooxygenase SsuD/methylene tetrahydromethanopterin reductase-like flavin-dependent oxidoreductase (luciferase family)
MFGSVNGFIRSQERRERDEGVEQLSYAELIDQGLVVCGDVQDCADQLLRLTASGADTVTLSMPVADADPGSLRRSLELFCHEGGPRVASAVEGRR